MPKKAIKKHKSMVSSKATNQVPLYNVPGAFIAKPDSDKKFMGSDLTRRVNALKNYDTNYKNKKRKGKK